MTQREGSVTGWLVGTLLAAAAAIGITLAIGGPPWFGGVVGFPLGCLGAFVGVNWRTLFR